MRKVTHTVPELTHDRQAERLRRQFERYCQWLHARPKPFLVYSSQDLGLSYDWPDDLEPEQVCQHPHYRDS